MIGDDNPTTDAGAQETPFRFSTLGTEVTESPDGLALRFVCCEQIVRFGPLADPAEIGREILEHRAKCRPVEKQRTGARCGACKRFSGVGVEVQSTAYGWRCTNARACLVEMTRRKVVTAVQTGKPVITWRQLVAVRSIANSQRVNAEDTCKQITGELPEDLTVIAAGVLIDLLKSVNRDGLQLVG